MQLLRRAKGGIGGREVFYFCEAKIKNPPFSISFPPPLGGEGRLDILAAKAAKIPNQKPPILSFLVGLDFGLKIKSSAKADIPRAP